MPSLGLVAAPAAAVALVAGQLSVAYAQTVGPSPSPTPAPAQIVARAPLGVTPAAETLLASSVEPRRLALVPGEDALSAARRLCGRLTQTYLDLLTQANRSASPGEAVIPACFVTRLDQRVRPRLDETWARLADRVAGVAGTKTLSAMLVSNAAASAKSDVPAVAASSIPSDLKEVIVPVTTEPVLYRPKDGVDPKRLAADLRAALGAPAFTAASEDELRLEAGVDPSLATPADCAGSRDPAAAWPFDVAQLATVMERNRARFGVGTPTTVAVVDNGIDGAMTSAFPLEEFSASQLELAYPDDRQDQDGNGFLDDVIGTNIYDGGAPTAFPDAARPEHGSFMASLALGGPEYRAWRRSAGLAPSVRLRIVSIVRRQVLASQQGNVTRYALPPESLARAVTYAETSGATIQNLSVSTENRLQELEDMLYNRADLLLIVAAGNSGTDLDAVDRYPAALSRRNEGVRGRVVTVAAHNRAGCLSRFSGRGRETVDIVASGERIGGAGLGGRGVVDDGTSQATALTTFVAGLLRVTGLSSAASIKERLLASADLDPAYAGLVRSEGRLNVAKALSVADDVVELDSGVLIGRLSARPTLAGVCAAAYASTSDILKVSRRIDGGPPGEIRLLVRKRGVRGNTEILHCTPRPEPLSMTKTDGGIVTFNLRNVVDLVPST